MREARRPVQLPGANPGMADVWQPATYLNADAALWTSAGMNSRQLAARYGVNRDAARKLTRSLYFTPNPVFQAAVKLVASFLVGDNLSYNEHSDAAVSSTVEEFWQVNAFGEYMTQRGVLEWLLDGELCLVWGQDTPEGMTARVSAPDVGMPLRLDGNTSLGLVAADMAERLTLNPMAPSEQVYQTGEFVWMANDALYTDVRGWPPTLAAAMASVAAVNLLNSRLRANELLSRLLGVYKALLNPEGTDANGRPDGGISDFLAKARAFKEVPEDGTVVPLIVKPGYSVSEVDPQSNLSRTTRYDGVAESLEFPNPSPGAGDAQSDIKAVMRLVGFTLGLPEHWLGEGGTATRTTADAMTLPAVKTIERLRQYLSSFMNRVIRNELIRKYGPDRLYTVYTWENDASGLKRTRRRKRVPAQLIEISWIFPALTTHTLEELVMLAEAAETYGWASSQTLSSGFGFDTPVEAELMAANGRTFGTGRAAPTATPTSSTGGSPDDQGTETDPASDPAAGTGTTAGRHARSPRKRSTKAHR